jgi:concanavalin A-like lectin/glucanase superfamily protein
VTSRRWWLYLTALLVGSCGGATLSSQGLGDAGADASGPAASLRKGLAGAWSFESDGKDHSGNALDLEVQALHFATGKFGKGLQLAGNDTPIAQRPIDDPSLNLATGDFTVSFWINFTSTTSPQFVAVKGYDTNGWFVGWAQTAWGWGLPAPKGGTFVPPGTPAPGTFHHVVFQRSGDMVELIVYSTSVGTAPIADTATPAASPFQVGGFAPGGVTADHAQNVVNGVVDDLAIWHRALVAEELAYLGTHAVP